MLQFYAGVATISILFLLIEIASTNDAKCNRTACYFISFGLTGAVAGSYTSDAISQFFCALVGAAVAIAISRIIRKWSVGEIRFAEERDACDEANRQL